MRGWLNLHLRLAIVCQFAREFVCQFAHHFLWGLVIAWALPACTVRVDQPDLAGQDVRLTILHTADIHSRLFPYQFAPGAIDKGLGLSPSQGTMAVVGGAARMATVLARQRAASYRVLHLDSGDMFEGAPVFNTFAGEVEMRALTRMGVNAMALGNHELDKGAVNLEEMKQRWGGFPILAANYLFSDPADPTQPKLRGLIAPFSLFNVKGLRVGVIGMGNLSSLQGIIEGGNSLGILPIDAATAVRNTVSLIRGSVDLVVLLSHLGLDEDEGVAQSSQVADTNPVIDGVDVILGGHLHIVLNPPKDLPRYDEQGNLSGHTVLCHSGAFAKYVGRLDLSVHVADAAVPGDRSAVKSYTYELLPIDDSIPEDVDMASMLLPHQQRMNLALDLPHPLAVVPCPVTASTCPKVVRSDPDGGDSQLGNLVATSMRLTERVQAQLALTNSLGIRADFESGPLNLEELYNVFPFDNTITTMYLSGAEVEQVFDFVAARSADRGCKTQAQVSGVWVTLDCGSRASCGPFDQAQRRTTRCTLPGARCGPDADHLVDVDDSSACVGDAPLCVCADPAACGRHACGVAGAAPGSPAYASAFRAPPRRCGPDLDHLSACAHGQACVAGACQVVDGPYLLGDGCTGAAGEACSCLLHPERCTPVLPTGEYRVAVNDYIAAGGSGFAMLKRNTTKFNTGIALRDALSDYITRLPGRCDPTTYSNIARVMCTDPRSPSGAQSDCTAQCCHDPPGSLHPGPGCDPSSVAFAMCDQVQGRAPQIAYDRSSLPCLDASAQAHDGRITTVGSQP